MFSNLEEDASNDWKEFISLLGEKKKLKGFSGYSGGLDTKNNTTGLETIYYNYKGFEVMYHVSTLLPNQEQDEQRVERKRHLGNDVVCIIFYEGNDPFDPTILTNQFNHVFFIVQLDKLDKTKYRLVVVSKSGVDGHYPFLPDPPLFEKNSFRDILISKCINSERVTLHLSPEFKSKKIRTRREFLTVVLSKYDHKRKITI